MSTLRPTETQDEVERRRSRQGTLTLGEILDAFARHQDHHMIGDAASEQELRRVEQALGRALPASFRAFLTRFGGGLFFHGHEVFGPRRVMIHDIELVPDILTMVRRVASEGLPAGLVPIHRARGVIHFLDLRPEGGGEQVVSFSGAAAFPNLASFLETVVLPRGSAADPP